MVHLRAAVLVIVEGVIRSKVRDIATIDHTQHLKHGGDVGGEVLFLNAHALDRRVLCCKLCCGDRLIIDRERNLPGLDALAVVRERNP